MPAGKIEMKNGMEISADRTWVEHSWCHVIAQGDVEKFLGHHVTDFSVQGIFSLSPKFIQGEIHKSSDPK